MTIAVPIEAARFLRQHMCNVNALQSEVDVRIVQDTMALVEFAERFQPNALPEMVVEPVAGELREIILTDPTLEADTFSLIRLNGRVFAPEVIEVEDDEEGEAIAKAIGSAVVDGVLIGTKQLADALVGLESVTRFADSHHLHPGAVTVQFAEPADSWPLFNLLSETAAGR